MLEKETAQKIFNSKSKIFKNKIALKHEYIPEKILSREKEVASLARILKDALNIEAPSNIFIYGDVGVGKTVITKYTLNLLLQEAKNKKLEDKINTCYINCKTVGSECQALGEIINILSHQRVPSKGKGWGKSTYYDIFKRTLNEKGGVSIIVLDEVDQLAEDAENVLYNLSRANSTLLTNAQISLIGISNKIEFYERLDSRTKSSLCQREIFINPYNALQLQEILCQRAQLAFNDGILQENIIPLCAALAAQEHGDARKAIDLLRASGEQAEREDSPQITEKHLREAQRILELNRTEELIKGFTTQKKIVLLSLLKNETANIENTTGGVYDLYRKICQLCGLDILTPRRITDILSELGTVGIANVKIFSRGRYGSTKQITLTAPFEIIEKALMEDEMLSPAKNFSPKTHTQKKLLKL